MSPLRPLPIPLHSDGRASSGSLAMAQPVPGWCNQPLRKPPIEGFVSQTCIIDTKRTNEDFRVMFQTTPVPLCRSDLAVSGFITLLASWSRANCRQVLET